MPGKLRVGIIGAGWPGHQHARGLLAGNRGILQACAEQQPERAAEFAQLFAPQTVYGDYADLLGDAAVDSVVICLPNDLHFPVALAALEGAAEPLNSAQQALYLMEMLDAIHLSNSTKREVPIARA